MIAIGGYFGQGNFGDDWLLEAIIDDFTVRQKIPSDKIILWPRARPCLGPHYEKIIFAGGLFQDATSARSCLYYTAMAALGAGLAGSRGEVEFLGASLGPLRRPWLRLALEKLLNSRFGERMIFKLRDSASEVMLRDLAPQARAVLIPDPTFFVPLVNFFASPPGGGSSQSSLRLGGRRRCSEAAPGAGGGPERLRLGIAINGVLLSLQIAARIVSWLEKLPARTELIFVLAHPDQDEPAAGALAQLIRAPFKKIRYWGNTGLFVKELSHLDALLSLRLHPAIAALRLGLPVATIYPCAGLTDKIETAAVPAGPKLTAVHNAGDFEDWVNQSFKNAPGNYFRKVLS